MSTARKIPTVDQAPPGFELTEEDLKAIAEAKERLLGATSLTDADQERLDKEREAMRRGEPGIPHSEVMRMLEERRRAERK
jgi:hypothetical protein